MDAAFISQRLAANTGVFAGLCEGVSAGQSRWRPAPGKWSILEVINHLYDEEREDFRARTRFILEQTAGEMPPIAPEKWVTERRYNDRDLGESLRNLLSERQSSLNWLNSLQNPHWQARYDHPKIGVMTAEMVLANWLAHDMLHIRQLNRLHYEYFAAEVGGISLAYAGNW